MTLSVMAQKRAQVVKLTVVSAADNVAGVAMASVTRVEHHVATKRAAVVPKTADMGALRKIIVLYHSHHHL